MGVENNPLEKSISDLDRWLANLDRAAMPRDFRKIVFIGPDCSGKSTLAELYAAQEGIRLFANRKIDHLDALRRHLHRFTADYVQPKDVSFVADQFQFPVDYVYCKALGQTSLLEILAESAERLAVENLRDGFRVFDVILVYVSCSNDELVRRYEIRGDELWNISQILKVSDEYRTYYKANPHAQNIINIDTTDKTPQACLTELTDKINTYYLSR